MSKFIGALANIGLAKEAVRGTAESAATFYIPNTSFSVDDKIEQVIDENTLGVIEDAQGANVTHKMAEGEVEGKIGDKSIGLVLYALLGAKAVSGPTDSAYTHTFTVAQSAQHQSLTVFQDDPNQDYKYANAMIKTFDLMCELGKFVTYKIGFQSKVGSTGSLTPSYSAENTFLPQHGSFKVASTQAGLDAASAFVIRSFRLTVNKNLQEDNAIGNLNPVDILNTTLAIEGELEFVFNDETFKTQLLADTVQAMRIKLTNTDVTIGASTNPSLQIDLNAVKYSEFTRNFANKDITTATVKFKAFYKLADAKMVTATLVNTQTSY